MFFEAIFLAAGIRFVGFTDAIAAAILAVLRASAACFSVVANLVTAVFASTAVSWACFACFAVIAGIVTAELTFSAVLLACFACFAGNGFRQVNCIIP